MSRLLFVLSNANKNQLVRNLSSLSSLNKSLSNASKQQFRCLASAPSKESNLQQSASTNAGSVSELDKPQWERNDRYKIFYGFDYKDEAADKASAHFFTFICFFGFFFLPGVLLYYYPDYKTNDWCYRQAHLEIARREKSGEPLVSPDYVSPEQIKLPSDEEIGDMEIIV